MLRILLASDKVLHLSARLLYASALLSRLLLLFSIQLFSDILFRTNLQIHFTFYCCFCCCRCLCRSFSCSCLFFLLLPAQIPVTQLLLFQLLLLCLSWSRLPLPFLLLSQSPLLLQVLLLLFSLSPFHLQQLFFAVCADVTSSAVFTGVCTVVFAVVLDAPFFCCHINSLLIKHETDIAPLIFRLCRKPHGRNMTVIPCFSQVQQILYLIFPKTSKKYQSSVFFSCSRS